MSLHITSDLIVQTVPILTYLGDYGDTKIVNKTFSGGVINLPAFAKTTGRGGHES